jgi:ABC-type polysaccharide/polyol phosphate export permease
VEFGNALVSGLLVAAAGACGRLVCPWLFFMDDFQAYHLPGLITVGRLIRAGELPLLTPTTWVGGNLVGEYQYAIFNPFVLLLSVIASGFRSLDGMALSIVLPSLAFVGFAVHHAARSFGIDTSGARTAALMVSLGSYLIVWCASSWVPGLYSLPWVVLLWSFLHRYVHRGGAWYPWVLSIAGLLTSGWPFSLLAGAALCLVFFLSAAGKRAGLLGGAVVGLLLGAVAVLPLVEYMLHARRASQGPIPDTWRVTWDVLMSSFVPLSVSLWQSFDGNFIHPDTPIGYLNVFLLFLVPATLVARLRAERIPRDRRDLENIVVLFLLLVGLPMPAFFHWPLRFLPVLHVFVSLACLRWWLERRQSEEFSGVTLGVLVGFGIVLAYQQSQTWDMVAINGATLAGAALAFSWAYRQPAARAAAVLCTYTLAVFLLQMYWYQDKTPLAVWGVDERVWASASPKLTFSLFTNADLGDPEVWNTGTLGNVNLFSGTPTLNGYSPVQIEGTFDQFFTASFNHLSATGPDIVERLREIVPGCQESWLDVIGVERLLVFPGQQALVPDIRAWLRDWRESRVGSAIAFERPGAQSSLPCLPDDLEARIQTSSSRETVLSVANRSPRPKRLILRRQWYPGYRAWLDGRELPVEAVGGIVLRVMIPAHQNGLLVVRFAPRSLQLGLVLLGLGVVGLLYGLSRSTRPVEATELTARARRFATLDRMPNGLRELLSYHGILRTLVARNLKDCYARSILGPLWTMLSPVLVTAVVCFVSSRLLPVAVEHFGVYVLSALILWNFFAQATSWSAGCLLHHRADEETDAPARVQVLAALVAAGVNFVVTLLPLAVIMLLVGHPFRPALAFLPVPIALATLFALGISLALAPLVVLSAGIIPIYRFVLMAWMFLTPIFYPVAALPDAYRRILVLNPMTHLVEAFRTPIYWGVMPSRNVLVSSTVAGLGTLVIGWLVFQRYSQRALRTMSEVATVERSRSA